MRFLPAHDTKGGLLFVIVVDAIVDEYKGDHRVVLCSFIGQFCMGPASSPPLMARLKDYSQLCAELSNHGDRGEHSPYIAREGQWQVYRMKSIGSRVGEDGKRRLCKKDQCQRPYSTVVDAQSSKMRLDMMRNCHLIALKVPTNRA
jgi:hypothetical protein